MTTGIDAAHREAATPTPTSRCGARTRAGAPCCGPAMANGRCRMHGGASTGPRTAEGMARMIAAKTTHGKYGADGAAARAQDRHLRMVAARIRLLSALRRLLGYLPAEMAARMAQGVPPELRAPMHPSQVAFLARRAADGGREGGAAELAPCAREKEREAVRAEREVQAPWRAAIAFARAARRGERQERAAERVERRARGSERAARRVRAGTLGGETENSRNDPVRGPADGARQACETACATRLAASSAAPVRDARLEHGQGTVSPVATAMGAGRAVGGRIENPRNDPMRCKAAGARWSGEAAGAARHAAALVPPVHGARPRQVSAVMPAIDAGMALGGQTENSRNDPMRGPAGGPRQSGEAAGVARLAAASAAPMHGARPDRGRGSGPPVAPATGVGRSVGGQNENSRNNPLQEPAAPALAAVLGPWAGGVAGGDSRFGRPASTRAALLRGAARVGIWEAGLTRARGSLPAPDSVAAAVRRFMASCRSHTT